MKVDIKEHGVSGIRAFGEGGGFLWNEKGEKGSRLPEEGSVICCSRLL